MLQVFVVAAADALLKDEWFNIIEVRGRGTDTPVPSL